MVLILAQFHAAPMLTFGEVSPFHRTIFLALDLANDMAYSYLNANGAFPLICWKNQDHYFINVEV